MLILGLSCRPVLTLASGIDFAARARLASPLGQVNLGLDATRLPKDVLLKGLTLHAQLQNVFNRRPPDYRLATNILPSNYKDATGRGLKVGVAWRWE